MAKCLGVPRGSASARLGGAPRWSTWMECLDGVSRWSTLVECPRTLHSRIRTGPPPHLLLAPFNGTGSGGASWPTNWPTPWLPWLRGPAITCRQTRPLSSASKSRPEPVFQARSRFRQFSWRITTHCCSGNSTGLKHAERRSNFVLFALALNGGLEPERLKGFD